MQVLQGRWDRTFSEHSYGFRPGRSAHQAVEAAQRYMAGGYRWCVDLDLEKFFDRVSHDKLMAKIAERVSDKRMLKLIRAFLRAGVMEDGLVSPVDEGTPMTPRTQKVTSSLSGGWCFGVSRVRIDGCRKGCIFTTYATRKQYAESRATQSRPGSASARGSTFRCCRATRAGLLHFAASSLPLPRTCSATEGPHPSYRKQVGVYR